MSMGEREFVRLETNDWRQADKASDTVASFAAMLNTSGCQEHGRRSSRDNFPPELADWPMPAEVLTCNAESKGTGAVDGDEETRRCAWLSLRKGYVLRLNKGVTKACRWQQQAHAIFITCCGSCPCFDCRSCNCLGRGRRPCTIHHVVALHHLRHCTKDDWNAQAHELIV